MKGITGRSIRLVFYWLILFAFAQAFSTVLEPPVVIFADGGDEPPGVLEAAGLVLSCRKFRLFLLLSRSYRWILRATCRSPRLAIM
jgi:hypothetical protein